MQSFINIRAIIVKRFFQVYSLKMIGFLKDSAVLTFWINLSFSSYSYLFIKLIWFLNIWLSVRKDEINQTI